MAYTVQNVPWYLKLVYGLYGWILALLWFTASVAWRATLKIKIEGKENLAEWIGVGTIFSTYI